MFAKLNTEQSDYLFNFTEQLMKNEEQESFVNEIIKIMAKYAVEEHPFINFVALRNYYLRQKYKENMEKAKGEKKAHEKTVENLAKFYYLSEARVKHILYHNKK